MIFAHKSVLLDECIDGLAVKQDGIYVDCTSGGGGHSSHILQLLSDNGRLICLDKDETALATCKQRLTRPNVTFVHCDFKQLPQVLDELGIDKVDGILADLGVSSYQIDNPDRGFSYMAADAPIDMRMDETQTLTAATVVNTYDEHQLYTIIRDYGEEKFAKQIARNIVAARQNKQLETCGELVAVIEQSIPFAARKNGGHPAKRTFQALRIEVNQELVGLEQFVLQAADRLNKGGRMAIITFHSLEDRIVKHAFADLATDCICPPSLPICVCGHRAKATLVNKKPILPSQEEQEENSRSRSAKLRVIERL